MKLVGIGLGLGMSLAAAAVIGNPQGKLTSGMIVHEWGTFLAMSGSDGVSLDGMYHEEHALPGFVHSRRRDQLKLRSVITKGETPVIYFYTDRPEKATVHVGFPGGLWTQWYPQASLVGPSLAQTGSPPRLANGHIQWEVGITPAVKGVKAPSLSATEKDALWNYARDVDAAYVNAADITRPGNPSESERFIFYRGLGQALLPVEFDAHAGGTVTCSGALPSGIRHLFVLRVANGKGAFKHLESLEGGESKSGVIPPTDSAKPLEQFVPKERDALAGKLVESGLFEKEARAMVNTWTESYFRTDGVRALFVLPQSWTDEFIPLSIVPEPKKIVRVMVGRVELLTPERERKAEAAVRGLASADDVAREKAFEYLRDQGRYVEPVIKRVLATTKEAKVKTLCSRLLMTDFVTELRSAVKEAADGSKRPQKAELARTGLASLPQRPVWVRAQLASLLHEVGLDAEAKEEATAALREMGKMKCPPMNSHEARHYLRGNARACEGLGDNRAALDAYEKLVRFGSQAPACGSCHRVEGPSNEAFYRDWWAGRKLASYAVKNGQIEKLIASNEDALAGRSYDRAARLILAYLYEAKGDAANAERMWAYIDPPVRRSTASKSTQR